MDQLALPLPAAPDVALSALVAVLSRDHRGKGHGISAHALATKVGIAERGLRTLVSKAREQGIGIVATPEDGYYIATAPDEIEQCCAFLRSRAMHSLHIEARLRRIPLPELLGQLRITS